MSTSTRTEGSILIDVSRLVDRTSQGRLPTGVDRVCLAYLRHFGPRAQAVLCWKSWRRIMPYEPSQELFALLQSPGPKFSADVMWLIARACLPPWPSQYGAGRIYFNHGHAGAEDVGLRDWLDQSQQRAVYMVHDLIPLTHPEYCRSGEMERHGQRLRLLLTSAVGILTNSQDTAHALATFAGVERLPLPPVQAVPLAPASLPAPSQQRPLEQPYFVVLGTVEPRKNHWLLLHVWRDLVEQMGADAPHLVVIGQRGWECENVVDLLERCQALQGVVHELPACADHELSTWLHHAQALLFPSFAEGYGMPLVEALAQGTPVIASDLAVFREVAGQVPHYLDPLDGAAWRRVVCDYATGTSKDRALQLQRLHEFRRPTWDEHFTRVEAFLDRLQSQSAGGRAPRMPQPAPSLPSR